MSDQTDPRTSVRRWADAFLHRGPGYDLAPEPAATEATDWSDLRQRIAKAIHRYDNQHALSGNDIPGEHHYGEADAVLASLRPDDVQAKLERIRAEVALLCDCCGDSRERMGRIRAELGLDTEGYFREDG